jgi:hypothetical protein
MGNPVDGGHGEVSRGLPVLERDVAAGVDADPLDFVPFTAAGETAAGEFRCAECGYGVAVSSTLPPCPMCSGVSWERTGWPGVDADFMSRH